MHAGSLKKKQPDRQASIASAMRTVSTERAGVEALTEALENGLAEPFAEAVELLAGISGRVIVTGVGKSGHIGSKIAATLASTGTPAFFVHPSEANHGDLGMIARDDAILAMSWSGETAELKGIVAYARRFSIPLIAVTAGENSALARESTVVLNLPRAPEACPHGLAPTTSTLLQLVIGDALAVALLEARGFTADHFRTFHPGGQLGANLMHVAEIMHSGDEIPSVPTGTSMSEAIIELSKKRFGCVCVIDGEGRLAGIVTDGDLARNLHRNLGQLAVDDIMSRKPKTVKPQMLASAAIAVLNDNNISALVVVEDERPVGVVHFHDLLRIGVV
ncbi:MULTISPECIES: KpsF/GutQ family sugar-phosphate isomerase [unclassified Mesorhizobium]|jgi:arabinose-5-phosphate isomerase|uniref:KpsF/GutQ family sugar-phosphate isomerase n=1 Tax=unclassified Mesorhizobium TaxID=325217 RepID=UPI0008F44C81|nr:MULTISPECIES: KpsF/GutQ family sugar-phosphate isomerase [unclassified Mesorhizobium]RJG44032.1 KpsF/GutQ family sugar-phosphate isomerase [Mesorhizobium sp. DCY119]SFU06539.1 arabinose-5-phosphate isomerase [Mesorhizobium sp. YR577]